MIDHLPASNAPVRGRDFAQYERHRDLQELPEEVESGRVRFSGAMARVYWLLRFTKDRGIRHAVGTLLGPPGWVPRFLLVEPWSGGAAGDRRVRDLREKFGVDIEIQEFSNPGGFSSTTTLYRIGERDGVQEGLGDGDRSGQPSGVCPRSRRGGNTTVLSSQPSRPLDHVRFCALEVTDACPDVALAAENAAFDLLSGADGFPAAWRWIDLTPGSGSLLAAPFCSSPFESDERYRAALRTLFVTGDLEREIGDDSSEVVLVARRVGGWSPLPVATAALVALGAVEVKPMQVDSVTAEGQG